MPDAPSRLGAAVEHTLGQLTDDAPASPPPPVSARVSAQDGAIVVTSDGATITVELTEPLRLDATRLAAELTRAANAALEQARAAFLTQLDDAPAGPTSLAGLGEELAAAYDAELRALDARIDRLAPQ